jgi:hypothetical protein
VRSPKGTVKALALPRAHRLHDDADQNPLAIGCITCPDRNVCGGLRIEAASFSCFDRCCGGLVVCDAVCPGRPEIFVERVREVGGLDLARVPAAPMRPFPAMPLVVPLIYSGASRTSYRGEAVALPLARMLQRDARRVRFTSLEELASEFRFLPGATVVLSGTDRDKPLERWWGMERSGRRATVRTLVNLGVGSATSPNFSLFTDRPRYDDLHSIKRIALVWQEMMDEGLPAALHVNARTETDWLRWTDFIVARPEVEALAYEFATPDRADWHANRLVRLVKDVKRPLRLVIRGGRVVLPLLLQAFDKVTIVDTTAYLKTMKRKRAEVRLDGTIDWQSFQTPLGAPLDELFEHNVRRVTAELVGAATPLARNVLA